MARRTVTAGSLSDFTEPLPGQDPQLGRARFELLRSVEPGHDLLVPELLALGLSAAAERGPALRRARSSAPLERLTAPRGRALAAW